MSTEIHRADWSILYRADLDEKSVPLILRLLMQVDHEWEDFPWYLVGRFVELLEKQEPSFVYLHMTAFFRARAAMLALTGDVLDQSGVYGALHKHQLQVGGIYRKLLQRHLLMFMQKHNMARLPECDRHGMDPFDDPSKVETNRDLIRRVIQAAERSFLNVLNFLSEGPDMDERIAGESVEFWVKRMERDRAVDVPVRVTRHAGGYTVKPSRDEAKQAYGTGGTARTFAVRLQAEFHLETADNSDGEAHRTECASHIKRRMEGKRERANAKLVEMTLAPVVEMLQKAILAATPPHKRLWWQNARERYGRETGPLELDKWRAVSKIVVSGAIEENRKPAKDRHSDYVTPLMLGRLLAKLNAPGASRTRIETDFAVTLRRYVTREEQKSATK